MLYEWQLIFLVGIKVALVARKRPETHPGFCQIIFTPFIHCVKLDSVSAKNNPGKFRRRKAKIAVEEFKVYRHCRLSEIKDSSSIFLTGHVIISFKLFLVTYRLFFTFNKKSNKIRRFFHVRFYVLFYKNINFSP